MKKQNMASTVLDSFGLLAYLRDESGAEMVQALMESAHASEDCLKMSEVNYAEVKYIVSRKDGPQAWKKVQALLGTLPIEFVPTSRALADTAADFKILHRISLADAFAAALAKQLKSELVAGDPEFRCLQKEVKIVWLK